MNSMTSCRQQTCNAWQYTNKQVISSSDQGSKVNLRPQTSDLINKQWPQRSLHTNEQEGYSKFRGLEEHKVKETLFMVQLQKNNTIANQISSTQDLPAMKGNRKVCCLLHLHFAFSRLSNLHPLPLHKLPKGSSAQKATNGQHINNRGTWSPWRSLSTDTYYKWWVHRKNFKKWDQGHLGVLYMEETSGAAYLNPYRSFISTLILR